MVMQFVSLYSSVHGWSTVAEVSSRLGWAALTFQTLATYFGKEGVDKDFTNEVAEAFSRVNYAQNADQIHAVGGMVSSATTGAVSVEGGNYQVFEQFLKHSKASVHLSTKVSTIKKGENRGWSLQVNGTAGLQSLDFDSVILAAPYASSQISLPPRSAHVAPVKYVHLNVTLFTTTSKTPKRDYFVQQGGGLWLPTKIPRTILTSQGKAKSTPEFFSMNYIQRLKDGSDEWVVKVFSTGDPTSIIRHSFDGIGWMHNKEVRASIFCVTIVLIRFLPQWDAYPVLITNPSYSHMKLDDQLYYVNGFEQ